MIKENEIYVILIDIIIIEFEMYIKNVILSIFLRLLI